jgi:hypothetical protein
MENRGADAMKVKVIRYNDTNNPDTKAALAADRKRYKDKMISVLLAAKDVDVFKKQYPECGIGLETKMDDDTTIFSIFCSYEVGQKIMLDNNSNGNLVSFYELGYAMFNPDWNTLEDPFYIKEDTSIALNPSSKSNPPSKWKSMLTAFCCCFPCMSTESNNKSYGKQSEVTPLSKAAIR